MKRSTYLIASCAALLLLVSALLPGPAVLGANAPTDEYRPSRPGQIEPKAGTWKTWVLTSGKQLRLPPPPARAATRAELKAVRALVSKRDAAALDQIRFWDTGAPGYRWSEMALNMALKNNLPQTRAMRLMTLLHVAIYDATVAAWDSKYAYSRLRPSELDPTLSTALVPPASPSYPSEHAVAAGAASHVLAYLFPADAQSFMDAANAAAQSRVVAGLQYPSDVRAGLALGGAVGDLVVERAKTDGSELPWTGSVPTEPGHWTGTNPLEPTLGAWKPWVLTSGSQFRPGPPPAIGSEQQATELNELKNFAHTPATDRTSLYWQFPNPSAMPQVQFYYATTDKKIFEERLDANAPAAARVYALESIVIFDAYVACWDAKYFYWAPRPNMVDPTVKTLFANPPHPSYPSAHSCISSAAMDVLGRLFPRDAAALNRMADEAAESRIGAGIHFRSDLVAGLAIGHSVAELVMQSATP